MFTAIISTIAAIAGAVSAYYTHRAKGTSQKSAVFQALSLLATEWRNRSAAGEKLLPIAEFLAQIAELAGKTKLSDDERKMILNAYGAIKARSGGV